LTEVARRIAVVGSLLTGQLGDLIMGNWIDDSEKVADSLQQGRLGETMGAMFAWSRALQVPVFSIFWRAFKAALSAAPATGDSDLAPSHAARLIHGDSLAPAFRRRLRLNEMERTPEASWRWVRPTRRKQLWALREMLETRRLQSPEPLQHLSYTHPFAHRPLVEFMLTIPPNMVCRPCRPRWPMRRALDGIAPPTVLHRRSKGLYDRTFTSFCHSRFSCCATAPKCDLVEGGYISCDSFGVRLRRLVQGPDCNQSQLRNLILLEAWLQQRETRARVLHTGLAVIRLLPVY